MVKEESIGHSKALIGAFFIQYFIYSLLYIAEACQYEKLRGKESGAHDVQKGDVQQMYEMDIRDVMKHEKGLSRSRSLRQNQQKSANEADVDQIHLDDTEQNLAQPAAVAIEEQKDKEEGNAEGAKVEENNDHWLTTTVNTYQKSTIWFVVAIALCALKGATKFAVFLAYAQVFFRAIQLVAMVFQKRSIARFGYGVATLSTFALFWTAALNDYVSNVIKDSE